jgi:hypothetical protein
MGYGGTILIPRSPHGELTKLVLAIPLCSVIMTDLLLLQVMLIISHVYYQLEANDTDKQNKYT